MGMFKSGVAVAASACALALVVGHGHLGAGFGRLGADAQATTENFAPAVEKAFGIIGSAMVHSGAAAKQGYDSANSVLQGAAASAKAAAAASGASALALRESSEQSALRSEIYGQAANRIAPDTAQLTAAAARLTRQKTPIGIDLGKQAALEATADNLLRDNAQLRLLVLPEPQRGAKPGSALAKARSAAARSFSHSFAHAMAHSSTPAQAALWALPAAFPPPHSSAPALAQHPVQAALAVAIAASNPASRQRGVVRTTSTEPCPAWALAPTHAPSRTELASAAEALGGQAQLFAMARAGAKPAQIAEISGKIKARRDAQSVADNAVPAFQPFEPM